MHGLHIASTAHVSLYTNDRYTIGLFMLRYTMNVYHNMSKRLSIYFLSYAQRKHHKHNAKNIKRYYYLHITTYRDEL